MSRFDIDRYYAAELDEHDRVRTATRAAMGLVCAALTGKGGGALERALGLAAG
jgi:3,4-dihydroxy-2-butanone 4-phosphate synthase